MPPSPWPARDTIGERNVLQCIAQYFDIGYPIESDYYSNTNIAWAQNQDALDRPSFFSKLTALPQLSGQPDCSKLSQNDFSTVQNQLDLEWPHVTTIETLIGNLESPFTEAAAGSG